MTKDQFDPAKNYDHFYTHHKFQPFPEDIAFKCDELLPRAGWTLDVAKALGYKSVLDLCCLDGFVSLTLADKLGLSVVGVDLSEPGIEIANQRAKSHNLDARYWNDSVEDFLMRNDQKFDMILHFEAVEHYQDTPLVLRRSIDRLNPGGSILISTPDLDGYYGDSNDDACHLRVYTHKTNTKLYTEKPPLTSLGKPIISLPDEIIHLGGKVESNDVWNDLIHLRATFDGPEQP